MSFPQESKKKGEESSQLEQKLELVDFKLLKSICSEVLEKAGVGKERAEKISRKTIQEEHNQTINFLNNVYRVKGAYDPIEDKVIFSNGNLSKEIEDFIFYLAHELTHAISDREVENENKFRVGLNEKEVKVGFLGIPYRITENESLNEGLTELIAEAIAYEYFRRKGDKIEITEIGAEIYSTSEIIPLLNRDIYSTGKALVELLVKSISFRTGVPEDVVFKALTRSMLNGDYKDFTELVKDDPVLDELISKIKKIKGSDVLRNYPLFSKWTVDLKKIEVKGLEDVFSQIITDKRIKRDDKKLEYGYFNPLYGRLD
ncbi:MAG: hypothetical protein JWN37_344 [Candidatus Nomurabacteria bacterium]|nr:hypothetical protein [Candidatus Nomurabacteria bacterium]